MKEIITCPVCKQLLIKDEQKLVCTNNHTFDFAKEGYINLLLNTQKTSNDPGDNKEMVQSRRAFLETESYRPLLTKIEELLNTHFPAQNELTILDIGCGEGYYLANILSNLKQKITAIGMDISKHATGLAAKKYKSAQFIVGNINYPLPFSDKSFDLILDIFAPRNIPEFIRVLKTDGLLLVVSPSTNHLSALREHLGAKVSYDEKADQIKGSLLDSFNQVATEEIEFKSLIKKDDLINLVKMTPLYWQIDQKQLTDLKDLETNFTFNISLFQKNEIRE